MTVVIIQLFKVVDIQQHDTQASQSAMLPKERVDAGPQARAIVYSGEGIRIGNGFELFVFLLQHPLLLFHVFNVLAIALRGAIQLKKAHTSFQ